MPHDNLYAKPLNPIGNFVFDQAVSHVFDDMITRSVPGYTNLLHNIGLLAKHHVQPHSTCYDLGCSLGAVSQILRQNIAVPGCNIIAVDNAPAMIKACEDNLKKQTTATPVTCICDSIENIPITHASLVVLNFTLQFIPPRRRHAILKRIHEGLRPQGLLVISEKIRFTQADEQQFHTACHEIFKKSNGYSDLEISQKRTALENVLKSDTWPILRNRLRRCGFRHIYPWFQNMNFISVVVQK